MSVCPSCAGVRPSVGPFVRGEPRVQSAGNTHAHTVADSICKRVNLEGNGTPEWCGNVTMGDATRSPKPPRERSSRKRSSKKERGSRKVLISSGLRAAKEGRRSTSMTLAAAPGR